MSTICISGLSNSVCIRECFPSAEVATEAREKAAAVADKLDSMKLYKVAENVRDGFDETLSYYDFPAEHRRNIWTNNPLERIMREIRRRSRVVWCFPDGNSAVMLAATRLRHIAVTKMGFKAVYEYGSFDGTKERTCCRVSIGSRKS